MKNYRLKAVLGLILATQGFSTAFAGEGLVFICHPGDHYAKNEIKRVFMGRYDDARPVDNKMLKSKFLGMLNTTEGSYLTAWKKNYFRRGTLLPQLKASDSEVIDFVKGQEGAMGYVSVAPAAGSGVEVCGN